MSATDELRRMLDERGVEWSSSDDRMTEDSITHWQVGHVIWTAFEAEANGRLWLNASSDSEPLTPEQAIAATLGVPCETCPQMDNPDSFIRHLMGCEWRNK